MEPTTWLLDPQIVMSGIGGVLIGFLIPAIHGWWRRHQERQGELYAMHCEMRRAFDCIAALRSQPIQAPLYRLPLTIHTIALPKLIGEGNLDINQIGALLEYLARADELNRGLDRAGQAHAAGPGGNDWLTQEFNRNRSKAADIVETKYERLGDMTVFDASQAALFALQRRHSLEYGLC